ncbi:MAG: helix-turn-helix domain-containing protein [Patescibacteria group bacterium]|jgi:cytoskeletal protein RodZ
MTAFTPKKLPLEESLGEKLRQARRLKNLRLEEAAQLTKIRGDYLMALEEERFDHLPAGLYGKNFLREYAIFLGLDVREIMKDLESELAYAPKDDPFSQKIVKKHKFIIFPKIIRNLIIFLAIAVCFIYLIFYFKRVVTPPGLTITEPADNLITEANSFVIKGLTEREAEVTINGELVLNNDGGKFYQPVNLKQGQNNIIIKAKKKYSRENTVTRQILVE